MSTTPDCLPRVLGSNPGSFALVPLMYVFCNKRMCLIKICMPVCVIYDLSLEPQLNARPLQGSTYLKHVYTLSHPYLTESLENSIKSK